MAAWILEPLLTALPQGPIYKVRLQFPSPVSSAVNSSLTALGCQGISKGVPRKAEEMKSVGR